MTLIKLPNPAMEKCGCKIMPLAQVIERTIDNPNQYGIMFCNLHAAAPEMLKLLEDSLHLWSPAVADDIEKLIKAISPATAKESR